MLEEEAVVKRNEDFISQHFNKLYQTLGLSPNQLMANFKGHALPGSFFLLFGLWWSMKYPLKFFLKKKKTSRLCFERVEFAEGIAKAVFSLVGEYSQSLRDCCQRMN
ncbi:hypothetical protein chiPu_0010437 [Chiloscyllium punctatum]|uniref:Uncharacterized protein n=1 Tax=Chiloscyllium punctatum TaxID=137246 RepID=A0A401SNL4_CHIPU|nr:hypothetical protein [Chiloscyllium punctatum]